MNNDSVIVGIRLTTGLILTANVDGVATPIPAPFMADLNQVVTYVSTATSFDPRFPYAVYTSDQPSIGTTSYYSYPIKDDFILNFNGSMAGSPSGINIPNPPTSLQDAITNPVKLTSNTVQPSNPDNAFVVVANPNVDLKTNIEQNGLQYSKYSRLQAFNIFSGFKSGEFQLYDNSVYVSTTLFYTTPTLVSVIVFIRTNDRFWLRCCGNIGITSEIRPFCPSYYGDSSHCKDLGNNLCNTTYALDPLCGCYPKYIQKNILDKNPSFADFLKRHGLNFTGNCAATCIAGTAYVNPDFPTCQMKICEADIINYGGEINTKNVTVNQQCGSNDDGDILLYLEIGGGILGGILLLFLVILIIILFRKK